MDKDELIQAVKENLEIQGSPADAEEIVDVVCDVLIEKGLLEEEDA